MLNNLIYKVPIIFSKFDWRHSGPNWKNPNFDEDIAL